MRISDWSSDVCSSDLVLRLEPSEIRRAAPGLPALCLHRLPAPQRRCDGGGVDSQADACGRKACSSVGKQPPFAQGPDRSGIQTGHRNAAVGHHCCYPRSEEHTSELQSLMHISYAVFCLKKKKK